MWRKTRKGLVVVHRRCVHSSNFLYPGQQRHQSVHSETVNTSRYNHRNTTRPANICLLSTNTLFTPVRPSPGLCPPLVVVYPAHHHRTKALRNTAVRTAHPPPNPTPRHTSTHTSSACVCACVLDIRRWRGGWVGSIGTCSRFGGVMYAGSRFI